MEIYWMNFWNINHFPTIDYHLYYSWITVLEFFGLCPHTDFYAGAGRENGNSVKIRLESSNGC